MKSKTQRVEKFEELKKIVSGNDLQFHSSDSELVLFSNIQPDKAEAQSPIIDWILDNTANTMLNLNEQNKPLIFIFGSAYKPGGGILSGARAQEEDISLHSSFYFQVKDNEFYKMKHKDYTYSDYGVYVKNGLALTDLEYRELPEFKNVSFVSLAAPNLSAFLNNKVKFDENELYQKYEDRLRSFFIFAENRGHKEIVVGPWGCGVFGLSPEKTSLIFNKIINENHYSGKIIFSIMNNEMFEIYKTNISLNIDNKNVVKNKF